MAPTFPVVVRRAIRFAGVFIAFASGAFGQPASPVAPGQGAAPVAAQASSQTAPTQPQITVQVAPGVAPGQGAAPVAAQASTQTAPTQPQITVQVVPEPAKGFYE